MKARVKTTGEVVEVLWDSAYAREYYDTHFWYSPERNLHFHERELDFIESKEIDWEQRTWDLIARLYAMDRNISAKEVIRWARDLVAEYRKGE